MPRLLFILIFGLSPFWAALLYVVFTHGKGDSADAPWLIFFSLPLCAVTLLVAFVTTFVFSAVKRFMTK